MAKEYVISDLRKWTIKNQKKIFTNFATFEKVTSYTTRRTEKARYKLAFKGIITMKKPEKMVMIDDQEAVKALIEVLAKQVANDELTAKPQTGNNESREKTAKSKGAER